MSDGDEFVCVFIKPSFDLFQSFSKPLNNNFFMVLQGISKLRRILGNVLSFDTLSTTNVSFVGRNIMYSIFDGDMQVPSALISHFNDSVPFMILDAKGGCTMRRKGCKVLVIQRAVCALLM